MNLSSSEIGINDLYYKISEMHTISSLKPNSKYLFTDSLDFSMLEIIECLSLISLLTTDNNSSISVLNYIDKISCKLTLCTTINENSSII